MKKIFAVLAAVVLVASMTVSAFAFDGSAEISLYAGNSADWQTASSDPVTVNADGEYTLKLSGISIDPSTLTVVYIKDTAVEADGEGHPSSDLPKDIQILTKSLKINGSEIALTEGYPTGLTDAGAFDVCWYNIWATSYFSTEGMETITDIEVTFEVVADGTAAPAETDKSEEAPAPENNEPAAEKPADKPAAENTSAPKTGVALAVIPMALAAAAAAVTKRR